MASGNAFLDAIRAAPDDDGPRLIYADWLEERGDPRGEFIRIQCVLESMPDDAAGRSELEAREHELLAAYQDAWTAPWREWVSSWEFRRGFVATITADAPDFLAHAATLFASEPVEHVRIHEAEDYVADLAACPQLRQVRVLDLSQCAIGASDAVLLAESPYIDHLHTLDLSCSHIGTAAAK